MRLAAAVLLALAPTAAAACGDAPERDGTRRIAAAGYALSFRMEPPTPVPGRPFRMRVATCAAGGAPAPALVRVGAWMPEHGHGMNYAPSLVREADGAWRVEGMMFHMAGRWQIAFDLGSPVRTERLTAEETVE
ncbi:FixH family protein [Stella sp.]|uniref:FixH family protein n=1 Tax=Stella sp. TaxID=2912054 RepID=UPI0035AE9AD5